MIRLRLRRPEPAQGGDPTQPDTPPPPAAGDILAALRAYGWPALDVDGRLVEGEHEWRRLVNELTPAERLALWWELGSRGAEFDEGPDE